MLHFNVNIDDVKIRPIERDDYYDGVIELLSQLTTIDKDKIEYEEFCGFRARIEEFGEPQTHNIYVMEYKDYRGQKHIIGHGTLLVEKKLIHNISKVGHIEDVVIHKDCRGSKLGKMMVEHLMKVAEERGCYKVILDCDMKNVEFYIKCGMKPKGIQMARYFDQASPAIPDIVLKTAWLVEKQ